MDYSVEKLMEEARLMAPSQKSEESKDFDFDKLASSIEEYAKTENHYDQALEDAMLAVNTDMEKIASFCEKAKSNNYSDEEIIEFLEKTAAWQGVGRLLTGIAAKPVKGVLKGAKYVLGGSQAAKVGREAAKGGKKIEAQISKSSDAIMKSHIAKANKMRAAKGLKPEMSGKQIKALRRVSDKKARDTYVASVRPKKPAPKPVTGEPQPGVMKKIVKPAALVGGGGAAALAGHAAVNNNTQPEHQVTYGY